MQPDKFDIEANSTYIIVLNYNAYQDTIDCLESIVNMISKLYKIVLVDNASTDFSIKNIQKWIIKNSYNNIKIIESDCNGGYAKGNNLGIKYSLKREDCKYIWILNNDTLVKSDTLEELIDANNEKNVDTIWGSKVLYPNGKIQSLGCSINNKSMLTYHNYNGSKNRDHKIELKKIDYIHGCSIFFNKTIIQKIGMFSEEYFMFFEDVDFCTKALINGLQLKVAQKSILIHKEGISVKKNNLEYLSVVNRIKFAKKYFPSSLFYVHLGIYFKILKSILLLKFNLAKKIIFNLLK